MTALICGSLAYDTVMVFPGRFREHILPDSIHMLNVSFLVPSMKRNFGGCSGNIAYNLRLLGGDGAPMATVGTDFGAYARWLADCGVRTDHVLTIDGEFTAQAFITTDLDANQINAFHPGAMDHSHRNRVPLDADITLGVIAPDGREGMLAHSTQFAAAGIPVLFDPGSSCRGSTGRSCSGSSNDHDGSRSMTTRRSCCATGPGKSGARLRDGSRR